jgi:AcrR family transcriptional regulator
MNLKPRQLEIIEAAGIIITNSGVSGLTIKNLANEMKFSESAIYRHFKSKEDIIVAMLNYLADITNKIFQNIDQSSDNPEKKFITLFQNEFQFFKENNHFIVAVFSDGLFEESQRINDVILKIMNIKIQQIMPIIMEGQQKGIFTNSITTDQLLHIVMGAIKLQMYKWRVANFQFDIIRAGENIIQSLLTIIKQTK